MSITPKYPAKTFVTAVTNAVEDMSKCDIAELNQQLTALQQVLSVRGLDGYKPNEQTELMAACQTVKTALKRNRIESHLLEDVIEMMMPDGMRPIDVSSFM